MSTSRTYHHGNLRNALLDAAAEVVDHGSSADLNLRELARTIGVSHAAPYKHFRDREELLLGLATQWMADFVAAQQKAASVGTPRARAIAAGAAYVRWAHRHPSRFAVIFDPQLNSGPDADTEFGQLVREHIALLTGLVQDAAERDVVHGSKDVTALRLWATAHGLAELVVRGLAPLKDVDAALEASLDVSPSA